MELWVLFIVSAVAFVIGLAIGITIGSDKDFWR